MTDTTLGNLTSAQLVSFFNALPGTTPVKRFESRTVAGVRIAAAVAATGKTVAHFLTALGFAPAPAPEARIYAGAKETTLRDLHDDEDETTAPTSLATTKSRAPRMRYFAGTDGAMTVFRASPTMAYQSASLTGRDGGLSFSKTPAKWAAAGSFAVAEITKSEYAALVARKVERLKCAGLDPARYSSPQDSWVHNEARPLAIKAVTVPADVAADARRAAKAEREAHHPNRCKRCGFKAASYAAAAKHVCADQAAPKTAGAKARALEAAAVKADAAKPMRAQGETRAIITAMMIRTGGATAKELYAATGWTQTSWNHQLNVAAKASGLNAIKTKGDDGATRYALGTAKRRA